MARIAAGILEEEPAPPRRAPYRDLLRAALSAPSIRALMALGAVFAGVGALALVGDPPPGEPAWSYPAAAVLLLGLATLLLLVPFFYAWRWWRAARDGVVGVARVSGVRTEGPGSRATLDALGHGYAEGEWVVEAGDRRFTGSFDTDAEWVEHLAVGERLRVLVHPTKPRVWFALGPARQSPSRSSRRSR